MAQPKIEVKSTQSMEVDRQLPSVRVVGSTIIARFANCMLKKPRPATPISRTK